MRELHSRREQRRIVGNNPSINRRGSREAVVIVFSHFFGELQVLLLALPTFLNTSHKQGFSGNVSVRRRTHLYMPEPERRLASNASSRSGAPTTSASLRHIQSTFVIGSVWIRLRCRDNGAQHRRRCVTWVVMGGALPLLTPGLCCKL